MLKNELDEIKVKGHNNLFFFVKYILGYKLLSDKIHKDLCDFIQKTDGDILDLEPRDHFKTTCISVGYTVWKIVNDPDIKILISHKNLKMSRAILGTVKQQFQSNEKLRFFYGNHVGNKWRDDLIISRKRKIIDKDPTVGIGGTDAELASCHYNIHINDDLVGLSDRYSAAARENTKRYGNSLVYTRDKGNYVKEITIGTRWHTEDYYNYLMQKREGLNIRIKQAILTDDEGRQVPYFKERYSLDDLLKIQREDPSQFSAQMMNEPQSLENQIFDELRYADFEGLKMDGIVNAYCDPAFTVKDESDFSVIICGVKIGTDIYIPYCFVGKIKPDQVINRMAEVVKQYGARRLRIESNAAQSYFTDQARKEISRQGISCSVEDIKHTTNKQERIKSVTGIIKNSVIFRKDWEDAYPLLIKQLKDFPNGHDDAPDALESLVSMYEHSRVPNIR